MDCPLISIIITAYNYGHLLTEALESACAQDYPNIEILVLDNASTDTTQMVMQRYVNHPRVRLIRNPNNIGATRNHIRGIIESRGEYLNFLSADDHIVPHFISSTYAYLKAHPKIEIAYSELNIMDANGTYMGRRHSLIPTAHQSNSHQFALFLSYGCYAAFETMLIPREIFGLYGVMDEQLIGADYELMIRWAAAGIVFGFIPDVFLNYRLHGDQDSCPEKFMANGLFATEYMYIIEKHLTTNNIPKIRGYEYSIMRHIQAKVDTVKQCGFKDDGNLTQQSQRIIKKLQHIQYEHSRKVFTPKLSIIILADRSIENINRTLISLAQQSYPEWEALIVYAENISLGTLSDSTGRIKIISLSEPVTEGHALNTALRIADGNCYTFMRSGNTFPENHIKKIVSSFQYHDILLTPTEIRIHLDDEASLMYTPSFFQPSDLNIAIVAPSCPIESIAIRRAALDQHYMFMQNINFLSEWGITISRRNNFQYGVITDSIVCLHEKIGTINQYMKNQELLDAIQTIYTSHSVEDESLSMMRSKYLHNIKELITLSQNIQWTSDDHLHWYRSISAQNIRECESLSIA